MTAKFIGIFHVYQKSNLFHMMKRIAEYNFKLHFIVSCRTVNHFLARNLMHVAHYSDAKSAIIWMQLIMHITCYGIGFHFWVTESIVCKTLRWININWCFMKVLPFFTEKLRCVNIMSNDAVVPAIRMSCLLISRSFFFLWCCQHFMLMCPLRELIWSGVWDD